MKEQRSLGPSSTILDLREVIHSSLPASISQSQEGVRKANISFCSGGGPRQQGAGEGLTYLLRLLFSFPPKLRISKHLAGKCFERDPSQAEDGQVLPQRRVCSLPCPQASTHLFKCAFTVPAVHHCLSGKKTVGQTFPKHLLSAWVCVGPRRYRHG